jgi:hypothetical protein
VRGGVDCSSGDEGHFFIASLYCRENRANVGSNEKRFVDAFNTQILPLTQSG